MTDPEPDFDAGISDVASDPNFLGVPLGELFAAMTSENPAIVEAAWAECYRAYHERVWSRVFYVVRTIHWLKEPGEVAIDVVSDLFAVLPQAVRSYREMGTPEAWLMRLALRAALRKKESLTGRWQSGAGTKRRTAAGGRVVVDLDDVVGSIFSSFDAVEPEARITLHRHLARWRNDPSKTNWCSFVDLYLQGYGHEDIAGQLGITPATSRTLLWKIRRELGAQMEEQNHEL